MKNIFSLFLILIILGNCTPLLAQKKTFAKEYTPLSINTHFGTQFPVGNLSERFGQNLNAGIGLEYISLPKGWLLGIDGYFLFGKNIKEDVLKNLRTPDGVLLADIGTYANVFMKERGYYIGGHIGRLFSLSDNGNRISGINISVGAGFLQHKIKITDENFAAPQVAPPYQQGYDRLTNGLALYQFIGYQIVSRDKTMNLSLGVDCTEGFTKNRRGFNFDTAQRDDASRLDILVGLRATFSIVLFSNNKNADTIEY